MNTEEKADAMYAELCRQVGDAVLVLAEANHETKRKVIADVLRTRLAAVKREGGADEVVWALQAGIRLLDY